MKKENGNENIVTKQETMPVGAILIARRAQRKCLKHTQKGITLVALVITIIVLLILAGVTINLTLGERGIFKTAEKAAKNYKDSQQEEMYGLNSLQNEINDTISGLVNTTPKVLLSSQITPANYGDYVNYEDGLDLGSSTYGHKTDWRIFYEDSDGYVYLISSYFLPYNQVPSGTDLKPYNGRPYTAYWPTAPSSYTSSAETSYARYMMNFKFNGSYNNGYNNMKCVSQLMNTSVWNKKFKNSTYAEDAIGAPTLEMWVDSWNTKSTAISGGYGVLTTSIPNAKGYYINGSDGTGGLRAGCNDNLYFPVKSWADANGGYYCLASPSGGNEHNLLSVSYTGVMGNSAYLTDGFSVRPLVRLKSTVGGQKDANGVWQLQP